MDSLDSFKDTEDWDQDADPREQINQRNATDRRLMVTAVILSLGLHIALGSSLLRISLSTPEIPIPDSISIQLIPQNLPPLVTAEPESETSETVDEIELAEDDDQPEETLVAEESQEAIEEQVPEINEEIPADLVAEISEPELEIDSTESNAEPTDPNQPLPVPSLAVIQSAVQNYFAVQQQTDRSWSSTCTNLQRVAGVVVCTTQEAPSYDGIEQSPESRAIYNFHNPVVERSRTEQTISTLSANSALLAANLANADIPEGLGDYLMSELESTITFYSEASNRVQDNMDRMTNTSDAALISRSLFDPWFRQQIMEQQRRRIPTRQDMQRMAECGSPRMLVLAVTELRKFADCFTTEQNFLFRLAPLLR